MIYWFSILKRFIFFGLRIQQMRMMAWVPLLACPAVREGKTLLGKPAVAPTNQPVINLEDCCGRKSRIVQA